MPRQPQYVTKKDLEDFKKEVKKMFKDSAKKDKKQDQSLIKKSKRTRKVS